MYFLVIAKKSSTDTNLKFSKKKEEKEEKPLEEGCIPIADQKSGMIIWAKLPGYNWWPCNKNFNNSKLKIFITKKFCYQI